MDSSLLDCYHSFRIFELQKRKQKKQPCKNTFLQYVIKRYYAYSLIPNKGIGWNNSIGRQNFQKLIIGEGGTISNKRVGWQTQSLLV